MVYLDFCVGGCAGDGSSAPEEWASAATSYRTVTDFGWDEVGFRGVGDGVRVFVRGERITEDRFGYVGMIGLTDDCLFAMQGLKQRILQEKLFVCF